MHPNGPAVPAELGSDAHDTNVIASRTALFRRMRLSQRAMALIAGVITGTVVTACAGSASPKAAHHPRPSVTITPATTPVAAALSASQACHRFNASLQAISRQVPPGPVTNADKRLFISYGQGLIHLGALLTRERPSPDPKFAHDLTMAGRVTIVFVSAGTTPAQANNAEKRWLTAVATDCAMISAAGVP